MIKGSVSGLPLTLNISRTLLSIRAFAPSPYTVSVGNASSFPSLSLAAASETPAKVGGRSLARMFRAAAAVTGVVDDIVPGVVAVEAWAVLRAGGELAVLGVPSCMGVGAALFQELTVREGEEVLGECVRVTRLNEGLGLGRRESRRESRS